MESFEFVLIPAFEAPITSGEVNSLIGDLSFSVSRQKVTSVFFFNFES